MRDRPRISSSYSKGGDEHYSYANVKAILESSAIPNVENQPTFFCSIWFHGRQKASNLAPLERLTYEYWAIFGIAVESWILPFSAMKECGKSQE